MRLVFARRSWPRSTIHPSHQIALELGQQVTVTYAQKDPYGRVLAAVFTPDCSNVNVSQVASGAAWYYESYKCEIDIQLRTAYATAQSTAKTSSRGLWASPAVAPWIYRNGVGNRGQIPINSPKRPPAEALGL